MLTNHSLVLNIHLKQEESKPQQNLNCMPHPWQHQLSGTSANHFSLKQTGEIFDFIVTSQKDGCGWKTTNILAKILTLPHFSHLVPYYFSLLFQLDDAKYIYYMFVPHLFLKYIDIEMFMCPFSLGGCLFPSLHFWGCVQHI